MFGESAIDDMERYHDSITVDRHWSWDIRLMTGDGNVPTVTRIVDKQISSAFGCLSYPFSSRFEPETNVDSSPVILFDLIPRRDTVTYSDQSGSAFSQQTQELRHYRSLLADDRFFKLSKLFEYEEERNGVLFKLKKYKYEMNQERLETFIRKHLNRMPIVHQSNVSEHLADIMDQAYHCPYYCHPPLEE